MAIPDWLKVWGPRGLAIAVIVMSFLLGGDCREQQVRAQADRTLRDALAVSASDHRNVVVEKNRQVADLESLLESTQGMLSEKTSEAAVLAELVTKLRRSGVRQVETVTRVDTQFLPGETVRVEVPVGEPAPDFDSLVRWSNDVPVARVQMSSGLFSASACEMAFKLRGVQGAQDSSFLLFVRSSCDNETRDVPLDTVTVTRIDEAKLKVLQARLGLGFSAGAGVPDARPFFAGALYLEWLHAHKNVTLLAPQVALGSHLAGGVNLVGYNIGGPLPLVDDLWLHVGGGYGAPFTARTEGNTAAAGLGAPSWLAWLSVGTRL